MIKAITTFFLATLLSGCIGVRFSSNSVQVGRFVEESALDDVDAVIYTCHGLSISW